MLLAIGYFWLSFDLKAVKCIIQIELELSISFTILSVRWFLILFSLIFSTKYDMSSNLHECKYNKFKFYWSRSRKYKFSWSLSQSRIFVNKSLGLACWDCIFSVSVSLVETVPAQSRSMSRTLKTGLADLCYITITYMTSIFMAAVSALNKEEFIKLQQSRQE